MRDSTRTLLEALRAQNTADQIDCC